MKVLSIVPHTVLLVSTDQKDYGVFKHTLEVEHWAVRNVRSCKDASSAVRENTPGVVVCQSRLPDGTWRDLLRDVLELEAPPGVIVLSGLVDVSLWGEVLNMGGYDVLPHPLDAREVARVVNMAFRAHCFTAAADRASPAAAGRRTADL